MKVYLALLVAICCVQYISAGRKSCEFDNAVVAGPGGNSYDVLRDVSFEKCKRTCITNTNQCNSADYEKAKRRCELSKLSYDTAKAKDVLRVNNKRFKLISVCPQVNKLHMYDGVYVGVNNYKEVRDVSVEECRKICAADTHCRHAEYAKDISRCKLSERTCQYALDNKLVRKDPNHVFIAACPFRSTCHFDNTFIAINGEYHVIKDTTEEQCRFECMTDPTQKCKSANFEKSKKRCSFSTMTHLQAVDAQKVRQNKKGFSLISLCPTASNSDVLEYPATYIAKHNYENIPNILKEECKTRCILDPKCRTAEYRENDSRCFLSTLSCQDAKKQGLIRSSPKYVLFAVCPLVKNCDKPNAYISGNAGGSGIRKLTSEGCKTRCLSDPHEKCKYAKYDKKKGRCYLSTQTYQDAQNKNLIRSSKAWNLYYAC